MSLKVVSSNETSCQFHTIELKWLNDRLDALNNEIRDPSYCTRLAFKTLQSIGEHWIKTMDLAQQFSYMKNLDALSETTLDDYEETSEKYLANYEKTVEVLELRGANELYERVAELYRKITSKSDVELFSKATIFFKEIHTLELEAILLRNLINKDENNKASRRLEAARALLNHVSHESNGRRDTYFNALTTRLSAVPSIASVRSAKATNKMFVKLLHQKL